MKAQINFNRNTKIFSLIAILALSSSLVFSQGLLAETAAKLFSGFSNEKAQIETTVSFASFSTEEESKNDSFNIRNIFNAFSNTESYDNSKNNNEGLILKSFQVSDVNISIEKNVNTESWMTESFSNNLETSIPTESWMTTPIHADFEEQIEFEEWMSEPIYETALENDITVEKWMTQTFEINNESELALEDWMTQTISNSFEEKIELEDWMTSLF